MKRYRMPFRTWQDDHAKVLLESKAIEFQDPWYYVRSHFKHDRDGNGPFMLNRSARLAIDRQGPFKSPYVLGDPELIDCHVGKPGFIFCPGPSLKEFGDIPKPPRGEKDCVVIAINSAGFAPVREDYWVISESGYMKWLLAAKWRWENRVFITTARCAIFMREAKVKVHKVYVSRWEEEFIVPARTPAVSISNALVTLWEMGCPEVYLVGLDQSKPKGIPYMKGLPHTPKGATAPYDDQHIALRQFQLPGFKIYNGSPHSRKVLPWEHMPYAEIKAKLQECYVSHAHCSV